MPLVPLALSFSIPQPSLPAAFLTAVAAFPMAPLLPQIAALYAAAGSTATGLSELLASLFRLRFARSEIPDTLLQGPSGQVRALPPFLPTPFLPLRRLPPSFCSLSLAACPFCTESPPPLCFWL